MPRQLSTQLKDEKQAALREKQYAAKLKQIEKQRQKQQAKLNDPKFIQAQKAKQRASAQKQFDKQRATKKIKSYSSISKTSKPLSEKSKVHQTQKLKLTQEKTAASAQRSRGKQLEKQRQLKNDASHQAKLREKQLIAQKKQQEKAKVKASTQISKDKPLKKQKPIKSKGLKGRTPTSHERYLTVKLASLGCICCRNQGWYTQDMNNHEGQTYISMHHVEGRVKTWAHAKQLPLCQFHHQVEPPSDAPLELFPLHGNSKTGWEKVNGTQAKLLKQVYNMIDEAQPWLEKLEATNGHCLNY